MSFWCALFCFDNPTNLGGAISGFFFIVIFIRSPQSSRKLLGFVLGEFLLFRFFFQTWWQLAFWYQNLYNILDFKKNGKIQNIIKSKYFIKYTQSNFFILSNTFLPVDSYKLQSSCTFSLKSILPVIFTNKDGLPNHNSQKRTSPVYICLKYSMIWILIPFSTQGYNTYMLY